jgi:chemotaxis protein MotB
LEHGGAMAGKKVDKSSGKRPVIIKREEVVEGGHHGGAWKVAYADFVTAMMAFFLLMWLLNATTQEQRTGLADYFSPNNILSRQSSGNGQPFGGNSASTKGPMASDRGTVQPTHAKAPVVDDIDEEDVPDVAQARPNRADAPTDQPDRDADTPIVAGASTAPKQNGQAHAVAAPMPGRDAGAAAGGFPDAVRPPSPAQLRAEQVRQERQQFAEAAQQLREAVRADPALSELGRQLAIDLTPEGLRIQILDDDHSPMFATGSAVPNERARLLLQKVTPVLMKLPESIALSGHTDAAPFRGGERSNWELSAERANATRRLLLESGLPEARIRNVSGSADRDPLLPAEPLAAANRRIAIVVLRYKPGPTP